MSLKVSGTGNLAEMPTLKYVPIKGEQKAVAEMRVFFDEYASDGQGGWEQKGGAWVNVSIWGKLAEAAADLLQKGARVHVIGSLKVENWTDKNGEARVSLNMTADELYLSLHRVEEITYRQKTEAAEATA